ncbi:T9SS type A sorting domain-containing protein [Dyadobacter jejuensis]|nr:T9SS type A sorting domain-containing protein [Dyadobacter jejuensis]
MNSFSSILICSLGFIGSEVSGQVFSPFHQGVLQPYKTLQQLRAEALVQKTEPDYYRYKLAQNIGQSRSNLRTQADCGNEYLCNTALPVTLMRFEAERKGVDQVEVSWETASETNNQGFEVERSFTGLNDFEKVGTIDGAGNSAKSKEYRFSDPNSHADWSYYRLKQLDWDGSYTYSRIVSVKGAKAPFEVTVMPNPGPQELLRFRVEGAQESPRVQVFSQSGRLMYENQQQRLDDDQEFSAEAWPALNLGQYFLHVVAGEETVAVPFVIWPE